MKRFAGLALVSLLAGFSRAAPAGQANSPLAADPAGGSVVDRGRYLATVADCGPCHAGLHGEPFAGGRPITTPFGKLRASNVTPDVATGIGGWSEGEFVRAVREGIGRRGEHLYPAMPYPYYTRMRREDVVAIRAFLLTQRAVPHAVDENELPFPFRIRSFVALWNALYFHKGELSDSADQSAQWNRGAYLVEGPGHCGACHTPKNRLGGDDKSRGLAGGVLDGWFSPDLRAEARTGLGSWSAAGIVDYLRSGNNAWAAATGPMAEVVENSTSTISDADLLAISVYLKSRSAPAHEASATVAANADALMGGRTVYVDSCAPCHGADGVGVPRLFPPLKGSSVVQSANPTTLARVVLHGTQNAATDRAPTAPSMPPFAWMLNDAEVAEVLTYIRSEWGNSASTVSAATVRESRQRADR